MELTKQQVKALYFQKDSIFLPEYNLYRIDYGQNRFYYTYKDEKPVFYISNTSLLSKVLPESEILTKWKVSVGEVEAARRVRERANYGTLMHVVFSDILISNQYDIDSLNDIISVSDLFLELNNNSLLGPWAEELGKDVVSFGQFLLDYKVTPLLIETPLKSDKLGIGTALDLFCKIDIMVPGYYGETYKSGAKAGEQKETKQLKQVLALVDFKSGKKVYSDISKELQLEIQKQILIENFPEYASEDIYLFNFHPKDWRSMPGYHFKDQSSKWNKEDIQNLIKWNRSLNKYFPLASDIEKVFTFGNMDISSGTIKNNYSIETLENIVKK